jgi:hypothetical protein
MVTDAKDRLRALDRVQTPDLWSRAVSLEPRSETDEAPSHRPARRAIAAIVAFAVFAGAGFLAWQAFRPNNHTPAQAMAGSILWPELTAEGLAATQARADSGDRSVGWRLDPKEVATRFAEHVLGWGVPTGAYTVTVMPINTSSGSVQATIAHVPVHCPIPPADTKPACPPPFDTELLTMRQAGATGASGVWSVTEVRASGLRLDLTPGDVVSNGTTLDGSVDFPENASAVPDFHPISGFSFGTGHLVSTGYFCGGSMAGPIPSRRGPVVQVSFTTTFGAGGSEAECGPSVAGFAWLSFESGDNTSPSPFPGFPIDSGHLGPTYGVLHYYGLTVVPMVVLIAPSPRVVSSSTMPPS